jgi:L-arabinonolactonase
VTQIVAASLWIDSRCMLGEGIIWSERRASLLWSDIQCHRLWQHSLYKNAIRRWALSDRLGALAECESGKLLLGCTKQLCIAAVYDEHPPGMLECTPLASVESAQASTRVNDGRTDRAGNFAFGTLNEHTDKRPIGNFYQFSFQRGLQKLDLPSVVILNSICFSTRRPNGYFCDSLERRIMRCDYDADGARVANVREFVRFAPDQGLPDGSVVDADGCLWNAEWGSAMVRRYTPRGSMIRGIKVPTKNPM